tara:strand:+ start:126 stop:968 length:843 start_codon:yes stop_codon:yes gene_type:complete
MEGWRAFWMSFRFLQQHGMRSWIFFFAIAAVVAWGGMACAWWYSLGLLREAILELSFLEIWESAAATPDGSLWSRGTRLLKLIVARGLGPVLRILFAALAFFLNMKVTKFFVLAVLGPLISMLSERAAAVEGANSEPSWNGELFFKGMIRGVKSAALLFLVEVSLGGILGIGSFLVLLFVPFLAPLVAVLSPFLFVALGSWFYGAAMFDCIWERHGMGSRDGLRASRSFGTAPMGLGFPIYLFMTIPFLAFPLGLILGPIGGAVGAVLIHKSSSNPENPI